MAHTKSKLKLSGNMIGLPQLSAIQLVDSDDDPRFVISTNNNANAAELVKRWNMHEELVHALECMLQDYPPKCSEETWVQATLRRAKQGGEV